MTPIAKEAGEWDPTDEKLVLMSPSVLMESAGMDEKRPIELRRNLMMSS